MIAGKISWYNTVRCPVITTSRVIVQSARVVQNYICDRVTIRKSIKTINGTLVPSRSVVSQRRTGGRTNDPGSLLTERGGNVTLEERKSRVHSRFRSDRCDLATCDRCLSDALLSREERR